MLTTWASPSPPHVFLPCLCRLAPSTTSSVPLSTSSQGQGVVSAAQGSTCKGRVMYPPKHAILHLHKAKPLCKRTLWGCKAGGAWERLCAAVEQATSAAGVFHRSALESLLSKTVHSIYIVLLFQTVHLK